MFEVGQLYLAGFLRGWWLKYICVFKLVLQMLSTLSFLGVEVIAMETLPVNNCA